jgi:hypothetical protein
MTIGEEKGTISELFFPFSKAHNKLLQLAKAYILCGVEIE